MKSDKPIVIAGAGPAGLTAAYELLKSNKDSGTNYETIVLEATDTIGGISQTVRHNGNRIDIGGHRFFSKDEQIMNWWTNIMPMQGKPSLDDNLVGFTPQLDPNGPSPETNDRVMLRRRRVSRIFYLRKFFDYPVSLKWQTLKNMGLWRTMKVGAGYLKSTVSKRPENSLEDFYINRFGKPLYSMFFENYTAKVWGQHPSQLGADWGSQRVKGLSITAILKDMLLKTLHIKNRKVETSLIEEFIYPKLGPGQLWETVASDVCNMGGKIRMEQEVVAVNVDPYTRRVISVTTKDCDGKETITECSEFISSMPIKDLVAAIRGIDIPKNIKNIAANLPYRDFITVGLLLDKLEIKNNTKLQTYAKRVPDTWIYIQENDVNIGRLQIFNNWSPYMVDDFENHVWIGLEYFCSEGDNLWSMSDSDFIDMAIDELSSIGIIKRDSVKDSVRIKIKKAYPAYYGAYYQLDEVRQFLDSIPNLYCVGRNGQHRYNNMDHSMATAFKAVESIKTGSSNKNDIWNVNTETEYHESKKQNH